MSATILRIYVHGGTDALEKARMALRERKENGPVIDRIELVCMSPMDREREWRNPEWQRAAQPVSAAEWSPIFLGLGSWPLLEIEMEHVGSELLNAVFKIIIYQTRDTLVKLTMTHLDTSGIAGDIFASLYGHPTLEQVTATKPDVSLFRALSTCPKLNKIALFQAANGKTRGLRELCLVPTLTDLSIGGPTFVIIEALESLQRSQSIRHVSLSNHPSCPKPFFGTLRDFLRENSTVEELAFQCLNSAWITPVVNALKSNRSLKRLVVAGTEQPGETICPLHIEDSFEKVIKDNEVLEQVIGMNYWARPVTPFYLRLNRIGRRTLRMAEPDNKNDWAKAIIANKGDTQVVFYLLSKMPTLVDDQAEDLVMGEELDN